MFDYALAYDEVSGTSGAVGAFPTNTQSSFTPIRIVFGVANVEASFAEDAATEKKFLELVRVWKRETFHISSITTAAMHPAYQQIIGMGMRVLPLILRELIREPNLWFWALRAIARVNPVPKKALGNLNLMADAWISWGRGRGLI